MTAIKTILFPTDFSPRANEALAQATIFAHFFDAKLLVYHAYHRPPSNRVGKEQIDRDLVYQESRIEFKFKELLGHTEGLSKLNHEFRKELRLSTEGIIHCAENEEIDLIIMATKGAKGFGELWGTKTAKIVQEVDIPVLVIPDHTTLKDIGKIGLFCDYSAEADYHTLDFLLEIAETRELDIDVVTLNRDEKVMTSHQKAYRQLVRRKLESVPTTFNITFSSHIDQGIIDYSKTNEIGLITILPKNYSFIEHVFHESLTQKMTFHSPIPLLVLK
ncbi:MAG: universal stress protein [Cyclobacteriaceae bacterium]|nr:universal stress protein [Cyclobacteriaceae bacterium HetDA_MAG_MS6]